MKTKPFGLRFLSPCGAARLLAFAAAAMCFPIPTFSATIDDGLIAFYPFTGNANDASTNGNNGTVVGAQLTTDRNGVPNQAYLFNGTSDYINIGQGVKPDFPLTITAWIYPTAVNGESYTIFRSGTFSTTGSYSGVMFEYDGYGFLYGYIGSGAYSSSANYRGRQMAYPPGVISANQWTHVALVWIDFQTTKFYVNGVLQTSQTLGFGSGTSIVNTPPTDGAIGMRDNPSYPAAFQGKLDEIRIYSRELTAGEINTLAIEPPQVTIQPSSVATNAGATVVFTANASGAAPLAYKWQFLGTNINGATTNILTLQNVNPGNSGTYRVIVSNSVGTNFADATLTVPAQVVSAMPQVYTNGVAFTVTLSVAPPAGTGSYAIQDQPPAGWTVTNVSSPGKFLSGKVTWIFPDGTSRNLSYLVTPPAGANGTNHFVGAASFNGTINLAITGVRDVHDESTSLNISTVNFFGDQYPNLTVTGKAGTSFYILVADGLESPITWRTNGTVTLSGTSTNWLDSEPMTNPRRFYKAQAAP